MRISLIAISLLTILTTLFAMGDKARPVAAAVNYSYSYDYTNVYNIFDITYSFTGLDSNTEYRWSLYTVDPRDGALLTNLGSVLFTGGTTTTAQFGGTSWVNPPSFISFPDDYVGPVAVVDSNGTILGWHFVAIFPTGTQNPNGGWLDAGNTSFPDKQVVSDGNRFRQNDCQSPLYAPVNSDGWQHTFIPCSVTTQVGGYTLFHYQVDSTYVGPSTNRFMFFPIPDATVALEIGLDDLLNYQSPTVGFTGATEQVLSFVVLNTNGDPLPFVNNFIADSAFTTYDNPIRAEFDPGVYNCSRNNGGWISDCESVWIVTDDPALNEWTLTANVDSVGENGTQTLVSRAVTPEVWDSYHGFQQVADASAGYSDTTVYAFSRARNHSYTVAAGVATNVTAQWINRAAAINSGLATPTEMEFEVQAFYDIVDIRTFEENVNEVLNNTGLDTDAGRAALLTIILFVGMLGTAAFPGIRSNIFAYLVVWTGLGSVYILGGFGTLLINTVFIILTVGMWLFGILMLQTGWENETD